MDEVVYYTRRTIGENGKILAWVLRIDCPSCGRAKMGKPVAKGKVQRRANEYVCPACGHTEGKEEHEPKLCVDVIYTCPFCSFSGEARTEYKRKSFQGVPSYVFVCAGCSEKIGVTRKMK